MYKYLVPIIYLYSLGCKYRYRYYVHHYIIVSVSLNTYSNI